MSTRRQFLFSTLIFAFVPTATMYAAPSAVEYVGGTVKSIPANSVGSLSFADAKELQFSYGESVYKLPYEQVTATDISKGEGHHILRKIPVPSLTPGRRKETLTISYKDAAGTTGTLNFELSASQAAAARDTIAAKKAAPDAETASQSNEWWGDKMWKTTRNQAAWESRSAQNSQPAQSAPAGTK
ncbi:MAG: hypothetical protein LAP38_01180 [Acidobacteriia bacterium]|nr:hypothetical protein [Terriglobia bacterium]